ncbi:cell division protein FtsQ/DivIB [Paludibacter sp.]
MFKLNKFDMKIVKLVLMILGVLFIMAYLIFALTNFKSGEKDVLCKDLIITIDGSERLITDNQINAILNDNDIHPIGTLVNHLNTDKIEHILKRNQLIKSAVCYHTPTGTTFLKVILRKPKMVVSTNENYYVDSERHIMPVPLFSLAYVPLVTGRVTKSMATTEIFDFISYLEKDEFWNAQISQIHIADDLKVELIPRVGDTTILLGSLDNFETKLNQVHRLYGQCFNVIGWNRYKYIDVRFDNQIVGVRF